MKLATCSRTLASGASALSESTASWASTWFSPARMVSTLSNSCSAGSARRMTALRSLPAAREAGAEFVDDDRQALAFGQAADVAEQVDVDGAVRVRRRAGSTGLRLPGRWGSCCSGGGSGVPSTRGWVGRQSTYFSPISACGRMVQLASARKSWKPGVFDVQDDRGLGLRRRRDRADGADLDAVDLDVLAGDDVAGVVEDRAHRVAAVASRPRRCASSTTPSEQQHGRAAGEAGRPSSPPDGLLPHPIPDPSLPFPQRAGRPHHCDEVARPNLLSGSLRQAPNGAS